ncbi:MAG: DUF438 domain-containing protein, partial [Thermoplasmata archaeon]
KYKKLKNPIMRRTLAKIATLDTVAKMGEMQVKDLMNEIKQEIERNAQEETYLEDKIDTMKDLIKELHNGEELSLIKKRFEELIKNVSPTEISQMEQRLIDDGMPEDEVKQLCDVHVEVFKSALEDQEPPEAPRGHPVHTFMLENRAAEEILANIASLIEVIDSTPTPEEFKKHKKALTLFMDKLAEIEKHYLRKENQLFPRL